MKKALAILLAILTVLSVVTFGASASGGSAKVTRMTVSNSRPYIGEVVSVDKGVSVVATARSTSGGTISIPKGADVQWFALTCGGKITLKPIDGGRKCEVRGIRPGVTHLFVVVFDANGQVYAQSGATINVQSSGVFKVLDDTLKIHAFPYLLLTTGWLIYMQATSTVNSKFLWDVMKAIGSI